MTTETCTVCGMGGYWVAWAPAVQEWRCVNHIDHGTVWITSPSLPAITDPLSKGDENAD